MVTESTPMADRADAPRGAQHSAQHSAALGAPSSNLLGDLHALQMMGEHLARSLRTLFEPVLRRPVKLAADPIKIVRFEDYADGRGERLGAHMLMSMAPLAGQALVALEGALVLEATDLFFGGTGHVPSPLPAEFAPSSEAIAQRIAAGLADRMGAAWRDLSDIRFVPGRLEGHIGMLSHVEPDDRLVLTRFQLQLTETRRSAVDILYPVASLKPIAPALCAKVQGKKAGGDPAWMASLTRAVMDVPLPVRSVLAEPVIPLSRLMALQPGDIIPISFGTDVPLIVADNRFAVGAVGAANGHAAVRVSRIATPDTEDLR